MADTLVDVAQEELDAATLDRIDEIESTLAATGMRADEVDLIVATDAEEILGIGDWGAGGIDITVGKLAVYTAAAGIDPSRVIPVMLDVGTNRESLLNDPLYLGYRHSRARGEEYDAFIAAYVAAARKVTLTEISSTLEGVLDAQGATGLDTSYRNGFERIRVSFTIKGDAPRETLEEIVERAKARSVVYDIVANPVPVDVVATVG